MLIQRGEVVAVQIPEHAQEVAVSPAADPQPGFEDVQRVMTERLEDQREFGREMLVEQDARYRIASSNCRARSIIRRSIRKVSANASAPMSAAMPTTN